MRQVIIPVLRFSPVSIIRSLFHIYSYLPEERTMGPLQAQFHRERDSLHQNSIRTHSFALKLPVSSVLHKNLVPEAELAPPYISMSLYTYFLPRRVMCTVFERSCILFTGYLQSSMFVVCSQFLTSSRCRMSLTITKNGCLTRTLCAVSVPLLSHFIFPPDTCFTPDTQSRFGHGTV